MPVPRRPPKSQSLTFFGRNGKKSAVKHSIEKPILLNFMTLSPNFCPRLSEETDFHFYLRLEPCILHFLKILVFDKFH